ncbi:peptide deformylase [Rhodovulum sulfidophilum]|uniref:Peptide deformylase n=1 Tax=Rhodovulum sulfidophilum TaxID=35806 RepID=A0A0D6B807_RHOSU|nr:peptide deformylase [Rhodovulum sulfidophilum]ANB33055.1 N-formylmethionyl-tRNA deformylase [Rhodovulum sulfidophilum DSM 1374]ANB36903.1 N-formylmethionyl-tRNA deformylase [Rhodovulum sulfidophilum]MBK5925210.1 peptide deformylase [Rhodovulum sulfidophilum]MBL3552042.1 peptide deformylase [Rhodovulum sulfidophilum]MBL3559840.1 peptide deformylase [Rhodovulum sulfidophilum]
MSVLPILRWPDPRLATACAPIGQVTPEIARLAQEMLDTMYEAPGRGLAAPQVGVLKRLFVMDVNGAAGPRNPRIFIDPVIEERASETMVGPEGCLSLPGIVAEVQRAIEITLRWTDLDGTRRREVLSGISAVCAQHEIDHLDGIVTLNRVDAGQRSELEAAYGA